MNFIFSQNYSNDCTSWSSLNHISYVPLLSYTYFDMLAIATLNSKYVSFKNKCASFGHKKLHKCKINVFHCTKVWPIKGHFWTLTFPKCSSIIAIWSPCLLFQYLFNCKMKVLCHAELRFQSFYFYQCCRMFGRLLNNENLLKHDNVVFKTCLNKTYILRVVYVLFSITKRFNMNTVRLKQSTVCDSNYSPNQLIFRNLCSVWCD